MRIEGKGKKVPTLAVLLIFMTLGMLVYANSLDNEFLFDDQTHVVNNEVLKSFSNLPLVFTDHLTAFGGEEEGKFYRPVESVTLMMDRFLWGLDPTGYHITNALLHITVSILLFYFIRGVVRDDMIALMSGVLYLVHPVHTEAVTYISGRADPLCTIFLFLMLLTQRALWKATGNVKKISLYVLVMVLFVLGLLSKEAAVVFPLLLMLHEYCLRGNRGYSGLFNRKGMFYVPMFVIAGLWAWLKNSIVTTEIMVENPTTLGTRLIALPRLIFEYIRLSVLPAGLHMEYKFPFPDSVFHEYYFLPFLFMLPLIYFIYRLWKNGTGDHDKRVLFFGTAWFLVALAPYLNLFFQLNAIFAEHWLYIAEAGFVLFAVQGLFHLFRENRRYATAICVTAAALFAVLTVRQNDVWQDAVTFYTYTVEMAPRSARAYNNLALEYIKRGELNRAEGLLEKALEVQPGYDRALMNLRMLRQDMRQRGM
jgi:hypothetical protein